MTIHAIFVAITEYPAGISQLPGCTNDLKAMRAFFADYASVNEADYKPTVLHNGDATRPKLIEAFREFEAAGEDDICVFYFSGHGSQVPAPREFWDQEPDRKCEALVLADYGQASGGFLADKELSYLIATHTKAAGQVLLLVDSCHSGTISRSLSGQARTTALNIMDLRFTDFYGHAHYMATEKGFSPPVSPHFILSACQPEQVAMEMPIRGVRHGLFTHYLIEVMGTVDLGALSYRELADRVSVRVKNHYRKQDVFAEASPSISLDAPFFNGKLVRGNKQLLHYGKGIGWYFDRGQIAGIQTGDTAIVLDGKEERTITVRRTDGGRSFVTPQDWLSDVKAPYPIIHLDARGKPLPIYVDTNSLSVYGNAVKERLAKEDATLLVVENPTDARYWVKFLPGYGLSLVLPEEERPLFASSPNWQSELPDFVEKVSKVATYEATLSLSPPTGNALKIAQAVDIQLEQIFLDEDGYVLKAEKMPTDGSAVFAYQKSPAGTGIDRPKLRFKIRMKNDYVGELFVGMLYLDESFGVTDNFFRIAPLRAGDEALQTSVTGSFYDEETQSTENYTLSYFDLELSDTLQTWGLTEITNYLKVFVSETNFQLSEYAQKSIAQQEKIPDEKTKRGGVPSAPPRKKRRDRWAVKDIPFTVYRPLEVNQALKINASDAAAPLSINRQPEGFNCEMMILDASLSVTRSRSKDSSYPCPTQGFFLEPASLVTSRSAGADETPIDMVQLMNVQNAGSISAETPLRLRAGNLGSEGGIVLAFDEATRRYYPVGFPDKDANELVVQELPPDTLEQYTRSLGSSVKLFFRKVASKYVPWLDENRVNELRRIAVTEDLEVVYQNDQADKIKEAVTKTDRPIALFIHGIIGDTTASAGILREAKLPDGTPLYESYEVVLTYDYENLNTPILSTSGLLRDDLARVGLDGSNGKTLHVYAHSMGGLVSRGFIELKGGDKVVSTLIQFGTPNGGSPFGTVAEWITPFLSRGLAAGAAAHPYLRWLLALRWFADKALVTLKEMKPGSETLRLLGESPGRGAVNYYLVNGDISLIEDEDSKAERAFLVRVMSRFDWREITQKVFFQGPTDIAVSLESQQQISSLDAYPNAVACDHLSYFFTPAAIAGLEGLLGDLFGGDA